MKEIENLLGYQFLASQGYRPELGMVNFDNKQEIIVPKKPGQAEGYLGDLITANTKEDQGHVYVDPEVACEIF